MNALHSEQLDQLAPALAAAQGKMKPAEKNATNPHRGNRYADLASVLAACRDVLAEHGLSIAQSIDTLEDGTVLLRSLLLHTSGQWIGSTYPVGKLAEGMRHQDVGSALTYGRRYSITALVGVVSDDDDDGERAGQVNRQRTPRQDARAEPQARRPVPPDRDEVNETFPARRNGEGHAGPTWAAYIADQADRAKKHWASEMAMANVDSVMRQHPDFQMPNAHRTTEHFVSHAIKAGAIKAEDIAKDDKPGVRDPAKAKAAMEKLFRRAAAKVKPRVEEYFAEKERALRVKLGMDDIDDGAQAEPAEAGAGREPGEDG